MKALNGAFSALKNGSFVPKEAHDFFSGWGGGRGRPSYGNQWEPQIRQRMETFNPETLDGLLLNDCFLPDS